MKSKKESQEFFEDLFVQSKHILTNTKFQSPLDGFNVSSNALNQFTPFVNNQKKLPSTSDYESEFLLQKQKEHRTAFKLPISITSQQTGLLSMTDEIDQLLT